MISLYCFPYAGAGPALYAGWQRRIAPSIRVLPVRLPGRGPRSDEALIFEMETLADRLSIEIERELDGGAFAFLGHSLGASIAFEVAKSLLARGYALPEVLFVSAAQAPHVPRSRTPVWEMTDRELVDAMRAMNGTNDEVFEHDELIAYLLPALRADLHVIDSYRAPIRGPALDCRIVAFGGDADLQVPIESLAEWSGYTTRSLTVRCFKGNHFFIHSEEEKFIREVEHALFREIG